VVPADFDWKEPDHGAILRDRLVRLKRLREHRESIPLMRAHYRAHPADFIDDWGMTYDPRLVDQGLPGMIPFLLFQKQRDFVDEVLRHWRERRPLIAEKSRDCGLSWVAIALSCTLCLHHESLSIGFGSRLTDYVDKIDEPKSLFWKARAFMENLPAEFRGGWEGWRDAPHMRINFPGTGSYMGGEGGDQIGRGDRRSIYFVDESAHLERPKLIDASLAATTNCRIDISSVNGMANPFAEKRWSGRIDVFVFDWRDDPRKDEEWYKQQQNDLDPVTSGSGSSPRASRWSRSTSPTGVWIRTRRAARTASSSSASRSGAARAPTSSPPSSARSRYATSTGPPSCARTSTASAPAPAATPGSSTSGGCATASARSGSRDSGAPRPCSCRTART
jgi:phage terminase large subunit